MSAAPSAPVGVPAAAGGPSAEQARRQFAALLGEFRRSAVLVPLTGGGADSGGFWTADHGGIRWILAFSDEGALARFALARGEGARPWDYQSVLGARLLDVAVPAVAKDGVPCGIALDTADEQDAVLFPPVTGVVPDAVAVDA
ncbi:SseB family protein [Streptomyces sp. Da 82-17]|uniref:SseB family protein n=1 Tax=Streptomyces sp. Da 82-17 TaxID=3377116 RepID=UPI0038D37965